jgi:hypothetical protein
MIGVPPFLSPSSQVRPIVVPHVIIKLLVRFKGSSGNVNKTAPLPASEVAELPRLFMAIILA